MRLLRVEIDGFGCLRTFEADLAPGLHIFHGPNEAGKSTLRQALLALLYGFHESDRRRPAETALRERFRPWHAGPYAARLEYLLRDGRHYRVERDFADPDVPTAVRDALTGREVTDEFGRGRNGNVQFMRRQLGMPKRVFEACAFVSHGELFEIAREGRASPQEIGDTIVSLADSGRRDVSAQSAIDRLTKALREQVGGPQARTTPLPVARSRLAQARQELAEIESARAEVAGDAAHLEEAAGRVQALSADLARSRYLLLRAEARELQGRLEQLRALAEEESRLTAELREHQPFARFPIEERDSVMQGRTAAVELRHRLETGREDHERQRRRLGEISEERARLLERQRQFGHLRGYPVEKKGLLDGLLRSWREAGTLHRQAQERLLAASERAAPLIEEHDRLQPQVGQLSAEDLAALTARLRRPAPGRPGVKRLLLAALHAAGRALLSALRWLLRRGRRTEDAPEAPSASPRFASIAPEAAAELIEKQRRYLEIAPDVRTFRQEQAAAKRAEESLNEAERRLCAALEGTVEDTRDPETAYETFCRRLEEHHELRSIGDDLEALDREEQSVAEAVGRREGEEERLGRLESRLRQQAEAAGVGGGSIEELAEGFLEGCRRREAFAEARRALAALEEKRGMLLAGRSPAELEQLGAARERHLEEALRAAPHLGGAETGRRREEIEALVSSRQGELQRLELEARELRARVEARLRGLRPRAEVEEEMQRAETEVASLERFGRSLALAGDLIGRAMAEAHRDFSPSVGRLLGEGLARVTGGRYQRALLDPATLRVTTEVPETGRLEDVEVLSRGTRAAAYLLLRVGLAQHMSAISEPVPLILDDPLVDLDDVRVEQLLELLLGLSRDVQILLFTKDGATKEWFERECAGNAYCRLTLLERAQERVAATA